MPLSGTPKGKEELILLPVEAKAYTLKTDPSTSVTINTGPHAIVASGYQDIGFWLYDVDDDDIKISDVHMVVGPFWRDLVQVSASVSIGGITSLDSDEVDKSRWAIDECVWDTVETSEGKRIRLKVKIKTQGEQNGWESLAYQVVATGWLKRMPTPDEISADI